MATHNRLATRYYSNKQEKHIADTFNGKVTPNSGATLFKKGDVAFTNLLLECKTSIKETASYSVKKEILEKIKREAFSTGKMFSALCFNFGEGTKNYFVIDENLFKILCDTIQNY